VLCLGLLSLARPASADSITLGGAITQAIPDGTGPASNNPLLNAILDGDPYTITLRFTGSITVPATYALSGFNMTFSDPSESAFESAFSSVSLSVTPSGMVDQLSLLGCLSTGSGCLFGNYLALNFMIPAAGLNASNVAAQSIFGLAPLDLLEDDGITDIQGTVTSYSYAGQGTVNPTPEPGALLLFGSGMLAVAWKQFRRSREGSRAG
jgi:hypothetical protein